MKEKKRIVSMDLIRIFSCLCVITCHFNACVSGFSNGAFVYPNSVIPNFYLENRIYLGDIGTSLFFILSGASLMLSYRRGNLKKYYTKRILAIYPMFYVAYFAATVADFLILKWFPGADWKLLLFSLIGFDGYLASLGYIGFDFYKLGEWFLGCILSLYLVFPLLHKGIEKKPVLTVLLAGGLYILYRHWTKSQNAVFVANYFFLRIPELLMGMLFVKYDLRNKPKRMLCIAATAAVLGWLLREHIAPLTLCVGVCMLLFAMLTWLGEKIKGVAFQKILVTLSNLTYPVFLVHHWMISRLVSGFDLAVLSRRDRYMFYLVYLLFSFLLAHFLKQTTDKILNAIRGLAVKETCTIESSGKP